MPKYIFVTGGVVSGLGKGITAASIGRLLKARGLKVAAQKLDPYINVDPVGGQRGHVPLLCQGQPRGHPVQVRGPAGEAPSTPLPSSQTLPTPNQPLSPTSHWGVWCILCSIPLP